MKKQEKVCIDCDKRNQKDLPTSATTNFSSASQGMPCESIYAQVTQCMNVHGGQISPCAREWDDFKSCHEHNAQQKS